MMSSRKDYRQDSPGETAIGILDKGQSIRRSSKVGVSRPDGADGSLRQDESVKVLRDLRSGTQQGVHPRESGFASQARGRNDRRTGADTEVDV